MTTSPAALKHVVLNLTERMNRLVDELEAVAQKLEAMSLSTRPYSFTPSDADRGLGTIYLEHRPKEAISKGRYWGLYADHIQELLNCEDDRDYWTLRVQNADLSLPRMKVTSAGEIIVQSEWVTGRIGIVPDWIFPEQFSYDPEGDEREDASFEEFFHTAFPEAE